MNTRFQQAHRRNYYPDTASDQLFKAEQPEYVQPTNQLSATFVKVDFTTGQAQTRLDEIAYNAERDYTHMTDFEQEQKAEIAEFKRKTEERAQRIRKQQFIDEKAKLEKVSIPNIIYL